MRKILLGALLVAFTGIASAQEDSTKDERVLRPMDLPSSDHFMLQLGGAFWNGKPDSIQTKGLSRTFNVYLMLDFPFRTNPKFSIALGPGIATDHVFLDEMTAGIRENSKSIIFRDKADTNHFEKYKIATAFLEAPIELRYSSRPNMSSKSIKLALGVKFGTMLSAWAKGKELQNRSDNTINDFVSKEKSKQFFNTTRISLTGRVGYGHFTAFTSYALTPLFKEGLGPDVNPMSIGITLSGL